MTSPHGGTCIGFLVTKHSEGTQEHRFTVGCHGMDVHIPRLVHGWRYHSFIDTYTRCLVRWFDYRSIIAKLVTIEPARNITKSALDYLCCCSDILALLKGQEEILLTRNCCIVLSLTSHVAGQRQLMVVLHGQDRGLLVFIVS